MTGLTELTLAEACSALRQKKCSAVELAQAHIRAIEKARALNAFIIETPEKALAMARQSDARIARGEAGPLEGIPLGIKDLYCTRACRPRRAAISSKASCRPMSRPSLPISGATAR